jgi:hypothetical protein
MPNKRTAKTKPKVARLTKSAKQKGEGPRGETRPRVKRQGGRRRSSVLERLIGLIHHPDILVTENTRWTSLGHDEESLDIFVRGRVSDEFGIALSGADAGSTVGALVRAINRALGI